MDDIRGCKKSMEIDMQGNCWYVHVDGFHEGAFAQISEALRFAETYVDADLIIIQSRSSWLKEINE